MAIFGSGGPLFGINGVIIGIVENIADPMQLGRVQLRLPTLGVVSNWARVTSFYAGGERGAQFACSEGDEALVAFEQGDINRPYVIGFLWNGVDRAPVPEEEAALKRTITTETGLNLTINDDPAALTISLSDKEGENQISINATEGKIAISAMTDISISAGEGHVSIAGGQVSITAQETLSLSATGETSLSSEGVTSITGDLVKIN